ncbi:MAG: RluA family pseudouridine synthase [Bacteroidales bacterium]|jgi:tRNA pseudouridine32 synthase/23S rRNA pseudouridine746 synthase|nr:RluA family pseudouridine synthase [Bacteroidales bacterium]
MLIETAENDDGYQAACAELAGKKQQAQAELAALKATMKAKKIERDAQRASARNAMSAQEYETLCEKLKIESLQQQYNYKQCSKQWRAHIDELQQKTDTHKTHIQHLKDIRKKKSEQLQHEIFAHYTFLNARGECKSLNEIFSDIPPSGAGECAAPKLLQYAYKNAYKPLAMAEFWWGQSPKSEIRKHKQFYPACKTKCEPILAHMLTGLQIEKNPIHKELAKEKAADILFEDADIIVVNKPTEMLSIPGKIETESVYTFLQKMYAESIYMVHRLDMATSGILVAAKHKEAYVALQRQFSERTVKKRYIALLQGTIVGNKGTISLPLRTDFDHRPQQMVCYDYGKMALTSWKVIERNETTTRVYLYPHTGRTHQLRVHAAHQAGLNAPIVGDDLYGEKSGRLYLHAEYIEFEHPVTKKKLHFQCKADF